MKPNKWVEKREIVQCKLWIWLFPALSAHVLHTQMCGDVLYVSPLYNNVCFFAELLLREEFVFNGNS